MVINILRAQEGVIAIMPSCLLNAKTNLLLNVDY